MFVINMVSVSIVVLLTGLLLGAGCHTAEMVGLQGDSENNSETDIESDVETEIPSDVATDTATSEDTDSGTEIFADTESDSVQHPHLFLHLDATAEQSVITDDFGVVTQWNDLSPHGHNAYPSEGNVLYPSDQLSVNGLAGLDFGAGLAELSLLDVSTTSRLLDFSPEGGAASGNSGVTVFVVFRVKALPGKQMYIIGTREDRGDLSLKINKAGRIVGTFADTFDAHGPQTVVPGDTIAAGISYEAATGNCRIWESKNNLITEETQETFTDLDAEGNLRLGAVLPIDAFNNYFQGMIGEVRVFNGALSELEFDLQRHSLVAKWGTN